MEICVVQFILYPLNNETSSYNYFTFDGMGCMEFDIKKGWLSSRLAAPCSEERWRGTSEAAKAAAKNLI